MSIEAELRRQITSLEANCKKFQKEAQEAQNKLNANKVLQEAIAALKALERNQAIATAAEAAAKDLKALDNPPESVRILLQTLL